MTSYLPERLYFEPARSGYISTAFDENGRILVESVVGEVEGHPPVDQAITDAALHKMVAAYNATTEFSTAALKQGAVAKLVEALETIANGEGAYGWQAHEYKQIANVALTLLGKDNG